jgi:hypothetical protein
MIRLKERKLFEGPLTTSDYSPHTHT